MLTRVCPCDDHNCPNCFPELTICEQQNDPTPQPVDELLFDLAVELAD